MTSPLALGLGSAEAAAEASVCAVAAGGSASATFVSAGAMTTGGWSALAELVEPDTICISGR